MARTKPDFGEQLRERGFRVTSVRISLLEHLWKAKHPLTVDELARKIDCDVVTVYRALADLCRSGIVSQGIGAAGMAGDRRGDIRAMHFSYARKDHHHHLICADCGFRKECVVCT